MERTLGWLGGSVAWAKITSTRCRRVKRCYSSRWSGPWWGGWREAQP